MDFEEILSGLLSNNVLKMFFANGIIVVCLLFYINALKKKLRDQIQENKIINRKLKDRIDRINLVEEERKKLFEKNQNLNSILTVFASEKEQLKSEINIYKGDPKELNKLDFNTILKLEKNCSQSLANIRNFKTNVNCF